MAALEPEIIVQHREELIDLLSEAAEVEHNLMCCYLFAAFSLKSGVNEGLTPAQATRVQSWKRQVMSVALDEMTHLALVSNLMTSLGAPPHFVRPNFPVSPGYHPSGVVVSLAPFELPVLDHFIYLERPEGVELPDGEGFAAALSYQRGTRPDRLMPSAQDYSTVGHLYRGIRSGLIALSERLGERVLFAGDPACQVGAAGLGLPGMCAVTDLASSLKALDTIVDQGEGSATTDEQSHYCRFLKVRGEYAQALQEDPSFRPARPVARNPLMRRPIEAAGRVLIDDPEAARVLDLANALYTLMLRVLSESFGGERHSAAQRKALLDSGIELMRVLTPVCEHLTTLPASAAHPGLTAGISFAMLRASLAPLGSSAVWKVLSQRSYELSRGASRLSPLAPALFEGAAERLQNLAATYGGLGRLASSARASVVPDTLVQLSLAKPASDTSAAPVAAATVEPASLETPEVERIPGKRLVLKFNAKRCIHSRHCVLDQPEVFLANVVGPWIHPDATPLEELIEVAHACPSGAIAYERTDGGPDEKAPRVNVLRVRENGPLAIHADLLLGNQRQGFRATLCRCGASKNKPFCDGSHHAVEFAATGEPATEESAPLAQRGGLLQIRARADGPLLVSGSLELCSGTGRTILRTLDTALCRCGGSSRKPFCDGTHARIGFRADAV